MNDLLGPPGTPLRRVRTALAVVTAVLVLVAVVTLVARPVASVWALLLVAVMVGGHVWRWPQVGGRPDPDPPRRTGAQEPVLTGLGVGVGSGLASALFGRPLLAVALQTVLVAALVAPAMLLAGRSQRRREERGQQG